MTGKRFVGAGLLALFFGSGCGDASSVAPLTMSSATAPWAMATKKPTVFQGEKLQANSVINVLYDWDVGENGPVVYASRPMGPARWPEHNSDQPVNFIYVVVYPVGSTVTGLMCYDTPNETCPDHGPEISAGAMQANPTVYGGGVLGHDHMSPQRAAHASATFVLFTNKAAANTHITTRAQVQAAVAAGNAFILPVPDLTFHNAPVDGRLYELATPWICPAYSFCSPP
jgi:hypothetical protein